MRATHAGSPACSPADTSIADSSSTPTTLRPIRQEGRLVALDRGPCQLGEAGAARVRLDVADPPTATSRAVKRHRQVAELAGHAVRAMEDLSSRHDGSTDARRDGQVDEVVEATRGAKGALAEGCHVRVAIQERREAERRAKLRRQRDVTECWPEVWWLDDDPVAWVDRPRRRNADARDHRGHLGTGVVAGARRGFDAQADDRRGTFLGRSRAVIAGEARAVRLDDSGADARATQVDRDDGAGGQGETSCFDRGEGLGF